MTDSYTLYGQEISLFTGKARAYLRWKGVPFEEIRSTMAVYTSTIVPRVGYPIIPIVTTPEDETLQDTTIIIDWFEEKLGGPSVYPSTPKQKLAALLLEIYGDDWLVIPAMHYRWQYNRDWAMAQFGKNAMPEATEADQLALGEKLSEKFRGFCLPLGITEETAPAIEQSYEALLHDLDAHFADYPYLFGTRPSIGDFGLTGPLYAHQYRDPASRRIMEEHGPNVARWAERIQEPAEPLSGAFLPDDEIPQTLLPVLKRMMAEQLPVLASTVSHLDTWLQENPDTDIPRGIGFHDFSVEGVTGTRVIMTYTQWMLQRALGFYHSLVGDEKQSADELLASVGGTALTQITINQPLTIENYRLTRAS
ncbi:glutathione S-transferase family protein [Parvularcula sp. IMCC14364]|uniref:glutathione S-transferase family protein n=1 Tax=Parvularcula sp. IMCC14364 TaxID=3067902 RepID=UPI002741C0DF|nr:glutathione S-transferase [Parvularcula sp. IMCC14364]